MRIIILLFTFIVTSIPQMLAQDKYCISLDTLSDKLILEKYSKNLINCLDLNNQATHQWVNKSLKNIKTTSRAYLQNQKFDKSILYANKALSISNTPKDSIINLNNLLDIYHLNGNLSISHKYLIQIKNIFKTYENIELKAKTYINAIKLSLKTNDLKSQKNYLSQLDKIFDEIKNPTLKGEYFYQKSRVLYHDKNYFNKHKKKTLDILLKSKNLFKENNNKSKLYDVLDLISVFLLEDEIRDYNLSEKYHLESIKIKKEIGNDRSIAISHNNYCNLLSELNMDIEAIEYCKKSVIIAERIQAFDILTVNYWNIATLYSDNRKHKQAINYFEKYDIAKDSLLKRKKEKEILKLQTEYQTKEKEQENKLLKKEKELYSEEDKRKTLQRNFLIGTTCLFLITSFLIFYLYHQKNKLNKIISSQNTELEKLNSFKNQLFSIMGHDMRGMMSKLNISQRKILRTNKKEGNKSLEKPISKMGAIIDGLNGFIENILYWGFTQTDKLYFNFEALNVNQIIDQVALNFKYDLENKKLNIIKKISDDFVIQADANTTKVVIRNLLANAIKYSAENTDILIEANEGDINHFIKITDQGKGIPKEIIPILFKTKNEKITQGTNGEKGAGLGLWLCKEMMEKNQGKISVESELGKGTSFILQFPKKKTS